MAKSAGVSLQPFSYVLPDDRHLPPEQQSEFILQPLTVLEQMQVVDTLSTTSASADGTITVVPRNWRNALELVMAKLLRTVNFPVDGPPGVKDAWKPDWPDDRKVEYLTQHLGRDAIYVMGVDLRLHAELTAAEKNLSGRAPTSTSRAPLHTMRGSTTAPRAKRGATKR